MSFIRSDLVAFDSNTYVLGIRRSKQLPACAQLLFDFLPLLRIFMPL